MPLAPPVTSTTLPWMTGLVVYGRDGGESNLDIEETFGVHCVLYGLESPVESVKVKQWSRQQLSSLISSISEADH
jgi:hypothetical protein